MPQKKRGVRAIAQGREIQQIEAVEQEIDSPLPAAEELQKLHSFRPDLVDTSITLYKEEVSVQRKRVDKIDNFVFIERMAGLILAVGVICLAFYASYILALSGHDSVAMVISGGTLVSIVATILKRK